MIASKQFDIPVYGSKATVIIFDDWKDAVKKLDKIGFTTDDIKDWSFCYGLQLTETIKNKRHFATMLQRSPKIESYFVHELYHLTQDILEWKEVDYRKNGKNEAYAYLTEAIYNKVMPFIKANVPDAPKARKKKKKKK